MMGNFATERGALTGQMAIFMMGSSRMVCGLGTECIRARVASIHTKAGGDWGNDMGREKKIGLTGKRY